MQKITNVGALSNAVADQINSNFQQAAGFISGNVYYLDPFAGSDGNSGFYPTAAVASLAAGYALLREGKGDVLALISNGQTTATARLGAAFTWSKNAAHLVGICSPVRTSQRSRIAPVSGVTAFTNLFTLTGGDCIFQNIEWFHGFNTGTAAQICFALTTGARNFFKNCHIAGMGDTQSATDNGSRSLVITGGGENLFQNCTLGIDTVQRTGTNATVEFKTGTARNVFENCLFPSWVGAGGAPNAIASLTGGMDRFNLFNNCQFINFGTAMTKLALIGTAGSPNGFLMFNNPFLAGVTAFGTGQTSMFVAGPANSPVPGISQNPT